jgi:hypothetical protein
MDFNARFRDLISDIKLNGRYRTFIELERLAGEFNFANNLGGAPLNPQFEPYRWDGLSAAAAE